MKAEMRPQALSKAELLTGPFPSAVQHACHKQSHNNLMSCNEPQHQEESPSGYLAEGHPCITFGCTRRSSELEYKMLWAVSIKH